MIITNQYPEEKSTAPLAPESPFNVNTQAETSAAPDGISPLQPRRVDSYAPSITDTLPPAYDTLSAAGPSRPASVQNSAAGLSRTGSIPNSPPSMVHLHYSPSASSLTQSPTSEKPPNSPSRGLFSSRQLMPSLPSSFSRSPPASSPYASFPPMSLETNGAHLDSGFPETLPSSPENPHPFTTHDVTGADWRR